MKKCFKKAIAIALSLALGMTFLAQPVALTAEAMAAQINHAPGAPTGLLTNESEHPMNVESAPMFDWWVNDEDYDEIQTAYQIRLYDDVTDAIVWDSGKVSSANQNCVPYTGEALEPGHPYSWEVRTWDSEGDVSPYSARARFATGLGNDNWDAMWIQGIKEDSESPLSISEEEITDTILQGDGFALYEDCESWSDYELTANITLISGAAGIAFRTSLDEQSGYVWQLVPGVGLVRNKIVNGKLTQLGEAVSYNVISGKAYTVVIRAEGNTVTTTLDGTKIDEYTDNDAISSGTFGFYSKSGQKTRLTSLSASETSATKILGFNTTINNLIYNDGLSWTDYTVEFDMVIEKGAAGFMFRASNSGKDGYMWQFNLSKGGLARHIRTGNSFTNGKIDGNGAVKCTLVQGQKHHVSITVDGNVITTYLDGTLIDTYTDTKSTYLTGSFGMRQGSGEQASLSNITVTAKDGTLLCRSESENVNNYLNGSSISMSEASAGSYSTEFSADDLAAWTTRSTSLPISTGTQIVYWAESIGDGVTLLNYGLEWTDYILSLDVQVITTSAGIVFRAPDNTNSGYMWAVRSNGILRLHKGVDNKYSRIGTNAESDLSVGFVANKTYHLTIRVEGETITTYVDGRLVNTRTANISSGGSIGFRTDSNEKGRYTNVMVTDIEGNVLFADDFSGGAGNWGTSGALNADNSYWYSRKEVDLDPTKEVKSAVAYVSGSQDYELTVNGVRIGRAQSYDYPGETKYQGWDITDAVKGKDAMALGVLTSYFGGAQGRAVSKPGLLGKFIVYYTDGTSQTVVTDGTWLTHDTAYSNVGARNGEGDEIEYFDARLALEGWAEIGYDTTAWVPVIVHGAHPTTTFYNLQPEIGHVEETRVPAVGITKLDDGTTVVDFGKVIPARLIVHFPNGAAGTQITIQEGYELLSDGHINTSTESTQSTNMTYVYTMKDGPQTYEVWTYLGFRYVSLPAVAGSFTVEDFEAIVVHAETVTDRESTLETSDEMLNQVFELMQRSSVYSVQNQFVDTPTREKGQFVVDAINISAATMTGSYERQMTRKAIIQFLTSSDRHWSDSEDELGRYTAVYPNNDGARDIPDYTLSVPLLVWNYYLLTGDKELVEYAYPYMVKTAGYVTRHIDPTTGLVKALTGGGTSSSYQQGIIETPPDRFGYDWKGTLNGVRTTINALSVQVYDTVAAMAEVLGYETDIATYSDKADDLRDAMNRYLINANGLYCDGLTPDGTQSTNASQHANSYAIVAGVPTDDIIDGIVDYIAGMGMRQGTMTAHVLMEALFTSGRGDAAIRMLTNTADYGWAKIISKGYTFIWENWHGSGSQSHGWGSASLWQVIEYVSGVEIIEAGAKTIRIDPAEGNVDTVKSHTVTARGAVDISYSGSGKNYVITIDVPANVTAEVVFPVVEGGKFVEINGKNGTNEFTSYSQVMTVGSGKRTFVYRESADSNQLRISAASLTLGSSIAMNYAIDIPEGCDVGDLSMRFTMNGVTTTVENATAYDGGYKFVYSRLAPQCMGDSIKAELYSGNTLVDTLEDYSIKAYLEELLRIYRGDEYITNLAIDLLNYGAAAQTYLGYKTNALVNAGLGGAATTAAPTLADKQSSATESTNSSYSAYACGVRFDYVNRIFFKFSAPSLDGVSVTDAYGNALSISSVGDGIYVVYSDAVGPLDFDDVYTFHLNVNGATVQTVRYSVNSYAYSKYDDGSAMGDLALALYRYGASVVAYDANK